MLRIAYINATTCPQSDVGIVANQWSSSFMPQGASFFKEVNAIKISET